MTHNASPHFLHMWARTPENQICNRTPSMQICTRYDPPLGPLGPPVLTRSIAVFDLFGGPTGSDRGSDPPVRTPPNPFDTGLTAGGLHETPDPRFDSCPRKTSRRDQTRPLSPICSLPHPVFAGTVRGRQAFVCSSGAASPGVFCSPAASPGVFCSPAGRQARGSSALPRGGKPGGLLLSRGGLRIHFLL
jgi:hypothetical protein